MSAVFDTPLTRYDESTSHRWMILLLAVITLVMSLFFKGSAHSWFPIRYVKVEGTFIQLDQMLLKQALLSHVVDSDFFSADLQAINDAAIALPWVKRAKVIRSWPGTIVIQIEEQRPVARWGKQSLLNKHGELFTPDDIEPFKEIVLLSGPDEQQQKIFKLLHELNGMLAPYGLAVQEFNITDRQSWQIKLQNGIYLVFGRKDQKKSLHRLLQSLLQPGQKDELDVIKKIDLRYPNGFAVTWHHDRL
ncbi:MAG: cell division protein FtsQ/DivIB [Methylococcaceae bacterium]